MERTNGCNERQRKEEMSIVITIINYIGYLAIGWMVQDIILICKKEGEGKE